MQPSHYANVWGREPWEEEVWLLAWRIMNQHTYTLFVGHACPPPLGMGRSSTGACLLSGQNRRNLELHNLPTNDWLVGARGIVDRCDLSPPPEAGEDITIVTALLDLGRGKSDSGSFKRPITVYVACVAISCKEGCKLQLSARSRRCLSL